MTQATIANPAGLPGIWEKPLANPKAQSVMQQMEEELGPFYTKEQEKMLMQKYGVIPPQFTGPEKNVIIQADARRCQ